MLKIFTLHPRTIICSGTVRLECGNVSVAIFILSGCVYPEAPKAFNFIRLTVTF